MRGSSLCSFMIGLLKPYASFSITGYSCEDLRAISELVTSDHVPRMR